MHWTFLFLSAALFAESTYCTFVPPSGWEIAQLKNPSPHVQIGFIGQGNGLFRPSMNLATEEIDVSLKEYIQAVKELQTADPELKWRDLGPFSMKGGMGRLIETSNPSPWGPLKILQAFLVQHQKAYILTAAVLKDDFPQLQKALLQSLQSLSLQQELWTSIPDENQRAEFQSCFASLGQSENRQAEFAALQRHVNGLAELGLYWQFLALQEGLAKINPPPSDFNWINPEETK